MRLRSLLICAVAFAAMLVAGVAAPNAIAQSPRELYTLNCWGCHRPEGEGIPGTAPPLRDAADFLRVPGGRAYLIEVPGVAESALTDTQVALVMNWIIANFSPGRVPADFKPYTAEEIHKYRTRRIFDLTRTRTGLIAKMVAMKVRPATDTAAP